MSLISAFFALSLLVFLPHSRDTAKSPPSANMFNTTFAGLVRLAGVASSTRVSGVGCRVGLLRSSGKGTFRFPLVSRFGVRYTTADRDFIFFSQVHFPLPLFSWRRSYALFPQYGALVLSGVGDVGATVAALYGRGGNFGATIDSSTRRYTVGSSTVLCDRWGVRE